MQTTSATYKEIVAGSHYFETKVVIGNETYNEDRIISLSTTTNLFEKVGAGNTVSGEIDLTIRAWNNIPRMAQLRPYVRAVDSADSTHVSEWIPKGVYFIDTREEDRDEDNTPYSLKIHGFDPILKMEQPMIPEGSPSGQWPRTSTVVMQEIATAIGVEIDPRTVLNPAITAHYPDTGTTMRTVAGYIAGMHASNWVITDEGKLRLVPLMPAESKLYVLSTEEPKAIQFGDVAIIVGGDSGDGSGSDSVSISAMAESLKVSPMFDQWSGVIFFYGDEDTWGAGDESGRLLEVECPWASIDIAEYALSKIEGKRYQPFSASNVILDPSVEIGDIINIGPYTSVIYNMDTIFDALYSVNISAPYDEEVDHEYPYSSPTSSALKREINKAKAEITVGLDEIRSEVISGDEQLHSEIIQKMDSISMSVTTSQAGDNRYASITLRVGDDVYTGQIILDGNVNVSGELSAAALYAAMGDMADLRVDELSTSRRIVKYLANDTSDDNFIKIADEEIIFYSGVYTEGVEQAKNPQGTPIYWESDISDATIGSDGYPYKNGVRVFITTEDSGYPVYVYTYNDVAKAQFKFEQVDNVYVPVLTLGAGNSDGFNQAKMLKSAEGAEFLYTDPSGSKIGIVMHSSGFTDLYGLRKTVNMDFTEWDSGHFTETLDGNINVNYSIEFDSQGRPTSIEDGEGHITTIVW